MYKIVQEEQLLTKVSEFLELMRRRTRGLENEDLSVYWLAHNLLEGRLRIVGKKA
jgi:hypothetical protein